MRENKLADRDAAKNIGFRGETYAVEYLKSKGYEILERNFRITRPQYAEVDIIAVTGNYLVFLEVKCRRYNGLVSAAYALNQAQQQRILAAAQVYLYRHPTCLQPRFDVICMDISSGPDFFEVLSLEHYENAFGLW